MRPRRQVLVVTVMDVIQSRAYVTGLILTWEGHVLPFSRIEKW